MTYLALARKYRPTDFDALIGQDHVVRALSNALKRNSLHHAYLFTGTRGVGKTTLARILAKSLNCEEGPTVTPCGRCSACQEIAQGNFADLIELDAATNTGIDDMRQLRENAAYAPTRGRYKVYVIDEVHMLSHSAFNGMLKTLEEPPPHVKFILATTDPQKIPVTVLSRCLQFNLRLLTVAEIVDCMQRILEQEGLHAESGALHLLARTAKGSMRDALSLLDQAIAYSGGRLTDESVREMLGLVEDDCLYRLLEALADGDAAALLAEADAVERLGLPPSSLLDDLSAMITKLSVTQWRSEAEKGFEDGRISALSTRFDAETLQLMYQICIYGRRDIDWAPDEQSGFVMTLLRLLAFRPDNFTVTATAGSGKTRAIKPPPSQGAISVPRSRSVTSPTERSELPAGLIPEVSGGPLVAPKVMPDSSNSCLGEPERSRDDCTVESFDDWHRMIQQMIQQKALKGPARLLAERCEWVGLEGQTVTLRLAKAHAKRKTAVALDGLEGALKRLLGRDDICLAFDLGEPSAPTYAMVRENKRAMRRQASIEAIQTDATLQRLVEVFEGTVDPASIDSISTTQKER